MTKKSIKHLITLSLFLLVTVSLIIIVSGNHYVYKVDIGLNEMRLNDLDIKIEDENTLKIKRKSTD